MNLGNPGPYAPPGSHNSSDPCLCYPPIAQLSELADLEQLDDIYARHEARRFLAARAERMKLTPEAQTYLETRAKAAITAVVHTHVARAVLAARKAAR